MSYDNVGLSTPRGSGTSGFVQRSLAHMKPRDRGAPYPPRDSFDSFKQHRPRQPDKDILEHDRKREVEVKVFELRDKLEDEGVDEDSIDAQCDALRKELLDKMNRPPPQANNSHNNNNRRRRGPPGPSNLSNQADAARSRNLKMHQVHELADAKIKQDARFRNALKISKDYQEGGHWRRQEERLRKAQDRDADMEDVGAGAGRPATASAGRDAAATEVRGRGGDRPRSVSRSISRSMSPSSARSVSRSRSPSRSRSRSRTPPPGPAVAGRRMRRYSDNERSRSRSRTRSQSRSRSRSRSGSEDGEYDERDERRRSRSPDRRR